MELGSSLPHSQKTPPLPVLSQINLVHAPLPILEDHLNNILSQTPGSSKWSPSFKSPQKSPVCTPSLSHNHLTLHPYVILLATVALKCLFKCTDCEDPHNDIFFTYSLDFLSLMSDCSPQHLVLMSLNLCSSINLRDQITLCGEGLRDIITSNTPSNLA